jgi:hypothetical protein
MLPLPLLLAKKTAEPPSKFRVAGHIHRAGSTQKHLKAHPHNGELFARQTSCGAAAERLNDKNVKALRERVDHDRDRFESQERQIR